VQLFDDGPYFDPEAPGAADADAVVEDAALSGGAGAPAYLSPSSASMYQQCPRRWRYRYIERLPDPPGEAALAGTFAHRVLELLFQEPAEQRTLDRARLLAREVWPETEEHPSYQALALDEAAARHFRWRGWLAIEGLWVVEDPALVQVKATERLVETQVGDVPFRGVVDRLDTRDDGSLVITDYKSGRAPTARFADSRLAQVLLYSAAVEASDGVRPAMARLVYLGQRVIDVVATDDVVHPVVDQLHATWAAITTDRETDEYTPKPGPLCAWCPYAARCDEGRAEILRRAELGLLPPAAPAVQALGLPLAS
jgi:putative RecB family exonuclease